MKENLILEKKLRFFVYNRRRQKKILSLKWLLLHKKPISTFRLDQLHFTPYFVRFLAF